MASGTSVGLLHNLRGLLENGKAAKLIDQELIERFSADHDEAAFAALVRRHGPLVLGVCRRVLRDREYAEDAFQATFLVLARSIRSLRHPEALSSWLHGVAHRVSLKRRAEAARQPLVDRRALEPRSPVDPGDEITTWRELRSALDEELARLPENIRTPLILCYLEDHTQDEAAAQLGLPRGTLKRRLEKGRELLRLRLGQRGITLSAALLGTTLGQQVGAAVPRLLVASIVRSCALFAAGKGAGQSLTAQALAETFLKTVGRVPTHCVTAVVLAVAGAVLGGTLLGVTATKARPKQASPAASSKGQGQVKKELANDQPAAVATDRYGDPLPAGAIARLGSTRFRHGNFVFCLAYFPDGKTLATGGQGRNICLWDAATGKLLRSLGSREVYALAISPDGKRIAAPTMLPEGQPVVQLFDAATGKEIRQFRGQESGLSMSLAFSHDGKTLAAGGHDKTVHLWNAETGEEIHRLQGHEGTVYSLQFSHDDKLLASTGLEEKIHLWDVASGKERTRLAGHPGGTGSVAFSPDRKTLVSGGKDQTIRVWDLATGRLAKTLTGANQEIRCVAFSPDGKYLASAHSEGTIGLWDVATDKILRTWKGHPHFAYPLRCLAFSPDGATLASVGGFESPVRLWETATGKERRLPGVHQEAVWGLAFGPDGKTLRSQSSDRRVADWDWTTGSERGSFRFGRETDWECAALSSNGKVLVTGERKDDATVRCYEASNGREVRILGKHPARVVAMQVSADGGVAASVDAEGNILLWDTAAGKEVRRLRGQRDLWLSVALSPDGKTVASPGSQNDRTIRFWEVATGKELPCIEKAGEPWGYGVFSPDAKTLATGGIHHSLIHLWDVASGKEVVTLSRQEQGTLNTTALAFSGDGRLLATGSGERVPGRVRVWELASGQEVHCFEAGQAGISSLAFAPDGRTLVSGGFDSTILIWDLTGRLRDGKLPQIRLTAERWDTHWQALAGADAAKAFQDPWANGDLGERPSSPRGG